MAASQNASTVQLKPQLVASTFNPKPAEAFTGCGTARDSIDPSANPEPTKEVVPRNFLLFMINFFLSDQICQYMSIQIRESETSPLVLIGELLVIEAQLIEDGGLYIKRLHSVFGN